MSIWQLCSSWHDIALWVIVGLSKVLTWSMLIIEGIHEVLLQVMHTTFLKMCTHAWLMVDGLSKHPALSKPCSQQTRFKALEEPLLLLLRLLLQPSFLRLVSSLLP